MNKGIVKYKLSGYIRSGKGVVPVVIFVAWLGMMYSIGPVEALGSFGLCSLSIFVAMLSISMSFSSYRNPMIEMSYFVKVKAKKQMYTANLVVIYLFSGVLTIVGLVIPILFYVTGGFTLYFRPLRVSDVLAGGALMFVAAICGGIIGQFADKRVISNQRAAVLIGIIIALFVLTKEGLIEKMPLLEYMLYILPPVSDLAKRFNEMQMFDLSKSIGYFLWIMAYVSVLHFIYIKTMLYKKMD